MTFVSGGSSSFTDERQANLSVFSKHQAKRRQAVESEMMCLLFELVEVFGFVVKRHRLVSMLLSDGSSP